MEAQWNCSWKSALILAAAILSGCSPSRSGVPIEDRVFSSKSNQGTTVVLEEVEHKTVGAVDVYRDVSVGSQSSYPSMGQTVSAIATVSPWHRLNGANSAASGLQLRAADFKEMHTPTFDHPDMALGGFLRVEGDCVYLDDLFPEALQISVPNRIVLSLPRSLTLYDADTGEIYFLDQHGDFSGPMGNGDYVWTAGASFYPPSELCGGEMRWHSPGLNSCQNNTGIDPCADMSYSWTFGVDPREARRRIERIPELVALLEDLRSIEADRVAAWGICHVPFFGARLFLFGAAASSEASQAIVEHQDDIHIIVGASGQHRELMKSPDERERRDAPQDSMTGCE